MENGVRLNKFLALKGIGSRRDCDSLIIQGRISVNGQAALPGQKVDPQTDHIEVQGTALTTTLPQRCYFKFYKPVGIVSTVKDPHQNQNHTLEPYLKQIETETGCRVFYVGRLDKESEGLMIFTNDGELSQRVTHPRFHVEKVYLVSLSRSLNRDEIARCAQGIDLPEGGIGTARVKKQPGSGRAGRGSLGGNSYRFTLKEGKKRQIRYMLLALRVEVVRLKRVALGHVTLGNLKPGELSPMEMGEIKSLRKSCGLDPEPPLTTLI